MRSIGSRGVVLSLTLGLLLRSVPLFADDLEDLPPPPESAETGLSPVEDVPPGDMPLDDAPAESMASDGADLPPPPVADASDVATPPGEEIPPLTLDGDQVAPMVENEVPADTGLTNVAEVPMSEPSSGGMQQFSSTNELKNVAMSDRIDSKNLVLWLSLGPSYGTLSGKGSFDVASTTGASASVGGLGYSAGIGGMLDDTFQLQFDFTGTPKTKNSTVDHAMFGFGPRLGFLSLMGVFGVQQGPDPTADGAQSQLFAIGARAGLDLVLKHGKDSRVSIGLSPEVFYITPQGADGYDSAGMVVSLRIYGYDTAF